MKRAKELTREELQKAIGKFINNGGIIEKLPDQKNVRQNRVGGKWGTSELGGNVAN